ncbi:hypothetical protein CcrColossus_gp039 [Caulobacter phage CcrColossus]|uniref:Uncharacterized protein n=1 Tax=Caulobacter phage CcrColossus TaxID=1211640 RepID=K4JRI0_9CAUD|nr:hypothetical protein CcrColossus_gp039 [Caulobacter phage CcrColossus]AFU87909.1 hypothetical protein CcrColossus_gp039 [Caulobacter phage CcrColossus]
MILPTHDEAIFRPDRQETIAAAHELLAGDQTVVELIYRKVADLWTDTKQAAHAFSDAEYRRARARAALEEAQAEYDEASKAFSAAKDASIQTMRDAGVIMHLARIASLGGSEVSWMVYNREFRPDPVKDEA